MNGIPEPTFEQVTKRLRETLTELQKAHVKRFGDTHPLAICMYAEPHERDVCNAIRLITNDIDKVKLSFYEAAKRKREEWRYERRTK